MTSLPVANMLNLNLMSGSRRREEEEILRKTRRRKRRRMMLGKRRRCEGLVGKGVENWGGAPDMWPHLYLAVFLVYFQLTFDLNESSEKD